MIVYISPDENPGDPGSVASDGTTERSVNLKVAASLRDVLARCGLDVRFDAGITFEQRVEAANAAGASLLVACAHNESTPGRSGTQFVFCDGGRGFGKQAAAADAVYAQLVSIPGWPVRIADAVEDVWECCGFDRDTLYAELLFMSPDDEHLWSSPSYPAVVAERMARGLSSVYGFPYIPPDLEPQSTPPPSWAPVPTRAQDHWWGPYVTGATQVVELPIVCHASVWQPGAGHWFRNDTIIGTPAAGEFCEWTLANLVDGVWYDMDLSGGPQGQGPFGRLPVDQSYWIDDSVVDTSSCGGTTPPDVARFRGGHWWSI